MRIRAEGKRVFLHCVESVSRTPPVAALYVARHDGISGDEAVKLVADTLPDAYPKGFLSDAVRRLAP